MTQMFVLSQENTPLAKAEVDALINKKTALYEYILISDSNMQMQNRLAYTRFFYKFLFHCEEWELENKIKTFDWNKYYRKSFCVRKFGKSVLTESQIADLIWAQITNPNVECRNPETRFDFYFTKKGVLCGLFVCKGRTDFDKRMPKLRPGAHPSTMKPRLAACLVNLTGIQKGVIYDPMCGTGGIVIEAAVMGFNVNGSDIDERMICLAKKNLEHYNLKAKLFRQDALKIKKAYNYIVTDLPYGKSTRVLNQKKFYSAFLKHLKKILKIKAIIVFPDFVKHKSLIRSAGLKIRSEYHYYLHRTLSRVICVIEP